MGVQDVCVIGGGFGGLTAAAIMAQSGQVNVTLLEASREWGGCAGKFSRGAFTFPAGATLGLGFQEGGIHDVINTRLGIQVEKTLLDTVMAIHTEDRTIRYFRDRERFLEEMDSHFPQIDEKIRAFFQHCWRIAAPMNRLSASFPAVPPVSAFDFFHSLKQIKPGDVKLGFYIRRPLSWLLRKYGLEKEEDFIHFIDGLLIDSLQTSSEKASCLLAAYALDIYHQGAYYLSGGLYKSAEALAGIVKSSCGKTMQGRKAVRVGKKDSRWVIEDHRGTSYTADHVVFNVPVEALKDLLDRELYESLPKRSKKDTGGQWGAFTLYLAVSEEVIPDHMPLFQQVVSGIGSPLAEGDHLFVSVSDRNDRYRAPSGFRTLTVSTHTDVEKWNDRRTYDEHREKMTDYMLQRLKTVLPRLEEGIVHLLPGAPRAWERFTGRPGGSVGGYPQTTGNSFFRDHPHKLKHKGLWICGDTVFPGAGTMAVSSSGYHAARSVLRSVST
ncbi:FAD-dependent oxidoreductase [Alteribacter lacisalsi]|nr:FAD-dependent oxidoreductase [Alteribacter lacisalsi]